MQKREKILLIVLVLAAGGWGAWTTVHSALLQPIEERRYQLRDLARTIEQKEAQQLALLRTAAEMRDWKRRSLPADALTAQRLYQQWLTDLAHIAGLDGLSVSPGRRTPQGTTYTSVQVSIKATGSLDQLTRFLQEFHRTDLLHRIAQMTVDRPFTRSNGRLDITLLAEGLALPDAHSTDRLFPQAELAAGISPGADRIAIRDGGDPFPTKPEFRIRLGSEFMTVAEITGSHWIVRRGVDGTMAASHADGETVELSPVRDPHPAHSNDVRQQLVAANFFVKPAPPRPEPPPARPETPRPAPTPPPADDPARSVRLVGSVVKDNRPEAMLYDEKNNRSLYVGEGSAFQIGTVSARIVKIGRDYVEFESAQSRKRLELGNLLTMAEQIASVSAPSTTGSPSADVTGGTSAAVVESDTAAGDTTAAESSNAESAGAGNEPAVSPPETTGTETGPETVPESAPESDPEPASSADPPAPPLAIPE